MRDYYLATSARRRAENPSVVPNGLHWEAMYSLISGYPDGWRPEIRKRLLDSIQNRDIATFFGVTDEIDGFLTKYGANTSHLTVMLDRQASCFLKKFPFDAKLSPFPQKSNAIQTWFEAEDVCRATNERLRTQMQDSSSETFKLIVIMRRIIYDVLDGDLTTERLMTILGRGKHGPGATTTNDSRDGRVTAYYKFADLPYSCSSTALPYFTAAISLHPEWVERLENSGRRMEIPFYSSGRAYKEESLVRACTTINDIGRTTFVPKNAKTFRGIEIGNSGDMYIQLGINDELTTLLKSKGIDLRNQDYNKGLAYKGSRYCYLDDGSPNPNQNSTIDLKSASDTVAKALVQLTLPPLWYAFLDDVRIKTTVVDGRVVSLEKFSAMGNGTTFPLESLLFWAASQAAQELYENVPSYDCFTSVFGDDLIVKFKHSHSVIKALELCGFLVNHEKSFLSGPFKESCGGDFFMGRNVRPFYLKTELLTYEDVYNVCNNIARHCRITKYSGTMVGVYRTIVRAIPTGDRTYGPIGLSTSHLQVPLSWMQNGELSPFLSQREKREFRSLIFSKFPGKENKQFRLSMVESLTGHNDPIFFDRSPIAKNFKGNERMKLFVSLFTRAQRNSVPFWLKSYEERKSFARHVSAASSGQVTRKGFLDLNVRLSRCSSWDSDYTAQELASHPSWAL